MKSLRENPPDILITFPMGIGNEVADLLNIPSISLFTQSDLLFIAAHDSQVYIYKSFFLIIIYCDIVII